VSEWKDEKAVFLMGGSFIGNGWRTQSDIIKGLKRTNAKGLELNGGSELITLNDKGSKKKKLDAKKKGKTACTVK